MGRDLPAAADYPRFLQQTLTDAAVHRAAVLWVCAGGEHEALRSAVRPALMIADLDEARFVEADEARWAALVSDADAVICNSEALRERFAKLRSDIDVLPDQEPQSGTWDQQVEQIWQMLGQGQ